MPRHARILGEKQVYHIMIRGNNRENIFIDEEDKTRILDILGEKKKRFIFMPDGEKSTRVRGTVPLTVEEPSP